MEKTNSSELNNLREEICDYLSGKVKHFLYDIETCGLYGTGIKRDMEIRTELMNRFDGGMKFDAFKNIEGSTVGFKRDRFVQMLRNFKDYAQDEFRDLFDGEPEYDDEINARVMVGEYYWVMEHDWGEWKMAKAVDGFNNGVMFFEFPAGHSLLASIVHDFRHVQKPE